MLHDLIDFAKFIRSCGHNYIILQNRFTALKVPVFYLFIPHHYHIPWKPLIFFSFCSFAFSKVYTIGIIWHVAFRDWLPLLNKMYTSFPHDSSFVFSTEYYSIVRMYCCLFIHSSIEGHLVCFQVLAVVNKAAVNIMCRFCRDVSFQLL